jgi:hypothetical protein
MKKAPVFEGLDEQHDRFTVVMEEVLRRWDSRGTHNAMHLSPDDAAEFIAVCAEGVASFEAASEGVSPVQRVLVGVQYTINALRQWREQGIGLSLK